MNVEESATGASGEAWQVEIKLATVDDHEQLVSLHLECLGSDVNLASMFGANFVRAAYRWFLTASETFVLKASVGDRVIGFTVVCAMQYTGAMLQACWRPALLSLLRRPWLAFHPRILRRLRATRWDGWFGSGVAQVAFTAVSPQFRGRGVGARLKLASINASRERGIRGLLTGIGRENRASIALNERFGFKEIAQAATADHRYYLLRFPEGGKEDCLDVPTA